LRFLLAALLALATATTDAGTFQVTPVRLELSASATSAALTIRNDGPDAVVVQMSVLKWTQADNADRYEPTQEALVTPPIATIPPGGEQLVRVGLRRAPEARNELAYRLYVQEVPPPPQPGFSGLQVALRIGIPVFVAARASPERAIDWSAKLDPGGALTITARNRGSVNLQVRSIAAEAPDTRASWASDSALTYVLPGSDRSWTLPPTGTAAGRPASVVVKAATDAGDVDTRLAVP
jgi:fimbrial chaperone protein